MCSHYDPFLSRCRNVSKYTRVPEDHKTLPGDRQTSRGSSDIQGIVRHPADYQSSILRSDRACARLNSTSSPVVSRSLWLPLNQGTISLTRSRLTMAER